LSGFLANRWVKQLGFPFKPFQCSQLNTVSKKCSWLAKRNGRRQSTNQNIRYFYSSLLSTFFPRLPLPSPPQIHFPFSCSVGWLIPTLPPSLPPAALPPKTHRHHSIIPSPRRQFRKSTCRLLLRAAQHLACQPATAAKLLLRGKYRNCSNKEQWQFKLNSGRK
jgi:hypothetical protein